MLHITNGDSTVYGLRESGLPGEYLPWLDALHDGPVPHCPTLADLSEIRARTLAGFGWSSFEEIHKEFLERDAKLAAFRDHEEVILWFEHDLYDQLQLLQLLDWFAHNDLGRTRLSLIQIDSHPEITPFHGLGQLTGPQLAELFPGRVPVSEEKLRQASKHWRIFTSDSHLDLQGLPRLLEEYPSTENGLSRLEQEILTAVASGAKTKAEIYQESRHMEEVPWGDSSVFLRIDGLTSGSTPALTPELALTATGRALLANEADWVTDEYDRWIGGVRLQGTRSLYRWDRTSGILLRTNFSER